MSAPEQGRAAKPIVEVSERAAAALRRRIAESGRGGVRLELLGFD